MDAAGLSQCIARLCSDDLMDQVLAKNQLSAALSPALLLSSGSDPQLEHVATALRAAAQPTGNEVARRFVATIMRQTATQLPREFAASYLFDEVCGALLGDEDAGLGEVAATAIAVAMAATSDAEAARVFVANPSYGAAELVRLAGAALAIETDSCRPLEGGHIARALQGHLTHALAADDVLLGITIATVLIGATRFCSFSDVMADDPAAAAVVRAAIAGNVDSTFAMMLHPFAAKAAAAVVAHAATSNGVADGTFTALAPPLAAYVAGGAPQRGDDFDAWAVAAAGLLHSVRGRDTLLCAKPDGNAAISGVALDVSRALRHGNTDVKIAALHVVECACASAAGDSEATFTALPVDAPVFEAVLNTCSAPAVALQAAAWKALGATCGLAKAGSRGTTLLMPNLAKHIRIVVKLLSVALTDERPAYGDDEMHVRIVRAMARSTAEHILGVEFLLRGRDADDALDSLAKLGAACGIAQSEAAL